MRFDFGSNSRGTFGQSVADIPNFKAYGRTIILSEVKSETIPNIIDIMFNLLPGGTDFINNDVRKTRVMVINNSEVYGCVHGIRDTRTRNVFIHHGIADCGIEQINNETIIRFDDLDWNVIVDKPSIAEKKTVGSVPEVKLSYDIQVNEGTIYRETEGYKQILIPPPLYYDEMDMIKIGNEEESYYDFLQEANERKYYTNTEKYLNSLYQCTLYDLIDPHTRIFKLSIQIDNLSNNSASKGEKFTENIIDLCSGIKYAMEKSGFSAAEIIVNGPNGYNIDKLKTYLDLAPIEQKINYMILCEELDTLNETFMGTIEDFSIMFTMRYDNIHVNIVDLVPYINEYNINKTDTDVKSLSSILKNEYDLIGSGLGLYNNVL